MVAEVTNKRVTGYVIIVPEQGPIDDSRRNAKPTKYFVHMPLTGPNRLRLETSELVEVACRYKTIADAKTSAGIINERLGWNDTPNHPGCFPTEYYEVDSE